MDIDHPSFIPSEIDHSAFLPKVLEKLFPDAKYREKVVAILGARLERKEQEEYRQWLVKILAA